MSGKYEIPTEGRKNCSNLLTQKQLAWQLLGLGWEIAIYTLVPLLGFMWLGRQADARTGTEQVWELVGIGLALVLTAILIGRRVQDVQRRFEAVDDTGKNEDNSDLKPAG